MKLTPPVIVFDVNETLSDMSPLQQAFTAAGIPGTLTRPWFAELLRDGFALTSTNNNPDFTDLATDSLHRLLTQTLGAGNHQRQVQDILGVFTNLPLHPDAVPGIAALNRIAELVTLSNGSTTVAEALTSSSGVHQNFSRFLSVQDAPRWKPAREAYDYAAKETGHDVTDLLLVAVHPWDIHGAHTAGLRTAWINRSGSAYPSYFTAPTIEADSITALATALSTP
jgi:2-haloacid dehalogenase